MRVVHYLNQIDNCKGDAGRTGFSPRMISGPAGPGCRLNDHVKAMGAVVGTVICNERHVVNQPARAVPALVMLIASCQPDVFLAGPAFGNAGYGLVCSEICRQVQKKLAIPVVTGMHSASPGAVHYKRDIYIVATDKTGGNEAEAMISMARLAEKLWLGLPLGGPENENYVPRGIRKNAPRSTPASRRAVDILLKKMAGRPWKSEIQYRSVSEKTASFDLADGA